MTNRPIKFRAWDGSTDKMTYWDFLFTQSVKDFAADTSWSVDKLMQFTGLTDKNGKEIYEGDIVRMTKNWIFEMKWGDEQARYYLHSGVVNVKTARGTIRPRVAQAARNARKGEVIGNICENPELV